MYRNKKFLEEFTKKGKKVKAHKLLSTESQNGLFVQGTNLRKTTMTDTNSPTNLTADLESSVERTNTTTNSNEIQPELASAIRSDESNS